MSKSFWTASAAAMAISITAPALAQERTYAFDIPAQDLGSAIRAFAEASHSQVSFNGEELRGKRSNALKGSYSASGALGEIVRGSGVGFEQAQPGLFIITSAVGNGLAAGEAAPETASSNGEDVAPTERGIAEILVVGKRSQNVDIRRSENDPQPYVVIGSQELQQSQAKNLEDFFRSRVPMNTQTSVSSQNETSSNFSAINLRGLGVNQTLILVDGRRIPRILSGGLFNTQGDINAIPLSSIERVEILPSTAGGIHGGNAVGGVINIIRKRDYNGLDVLANYGGTFRGGGEVFQAELTGGFSPNHGRTQVSFSATHSASHPLFMDDNDLWREGRERFVENGGPDLNSTVFSGSTPNIRSANGSNLKLDAAYGGATLSSNHTFIPPGYRGVSVDGVAGLIANLGQYNLELSDDARGSRRVVRSNPRTRSANINVRHEISRAIDVFADFTFYDNLGRSVLPRFNNFVTLPANAPNNPFQQSIRVYFPTTGLDRASESRSQTLSATAGLIAKLGAGWATNVDYQWSRSRNKSSGVTKPLVSSVTSAFSSGTLDVMKDIAAFPLDFSPYLLNARTVSGPFDQVQNVATVRASGPLIILPGGPATLTVAGEYRDEDSEDAINKAPDTTLVIPARSRTSKSGYAEIRAPIVGDRNAFSLMYALELEAALRYERYSTTVADPQSYDGLAPPPPITQLKTALHSTDFTTAVRWSPIEALSLRASYSTGFLPPEIDQLVPSLFTDEFGGILGYTDPLRGNELVGSAAPYDFISGGHAGLGPESSKSFSIGAIFETKFVSGFRLSLDFTRIHKTNEILETGSNGQFFIDNEEIFPDRIVRGAPLPGDPPGTPGPIIFIDAGPVNVSKAKVEAWDLQADYRIESQRFGSFHFYAIGTYEPEFRRQLIPTSPEYQTAGYTNGVVRWKGNGGLDWSLGGLSIGWNVQYYGSYSVRRNEPGGAALDDRAVQIEGRERIPRQIYHDLTVSYRFERAPGSALSGLELRAGVQNLFDHKPPVLANPTLLLGAFGDPRLRRYTFSLTKHFGR